MNSPVYRLFVIIQLIQVFESFGGEGKREYTSKFNSFQQSIEDWSPSDLRNKIKHTAAVTYELGTPQYKILNPNEQPEIITEDHPNYLENLKRYGQLPVDNNSHNNGKDIETSKENKVHFIFLKQQQLSKPNKKLRRTDVQLKVPHGDSIKKKFDSSAKILLSKQYDKSLLKAAKNERSEIKVTQTLVDLTEQQTNHPELYKDVSSYIPALTSCRTLTFNKPNYYKPFSDPVKSFYQVKIPPHIRDFEKLYKEALLLHEKNVHPRQQFIDF